MAETAHGLRVLIVTDDDAGEAASAPVASPHRRFADLLAAGHAAPPRAADPMADLGIQYTSGTTSRPKAVLWTHANALWGAQMNALHMRLREDDITLTFLPLFHTNAQSYSMLGSMWVARRWWYSRALGVALSEVSLRNRCTWSSLIPFCVKALLDVPKPDEPITIDSGARRSRCRRRARISASPLRLVGMTETYAGHRRRTREPGPEAVHRAPVARLRDRQSPRRCSPAQPGARGALFIRGVRGVSLFKENFSDPKRTRKPLTPTVGSTPANWSESTGRRTRLGRPPQGHAQGRRRERGRLRDRGGADGAGWVRACAAVAQKQYMLDEVRAAFVLPAPGAPAACPRGCSMRARKLADSKVPRHIELVDDMPRSSFKDRKERVAREIAGDQKEAVIE